MANFMFHQEVEVWYVLPALKRAIALKMKEMGLKQTDIAKKLNLAKSSISQYLKNKRASKVKFNKKFEKEIKKSAANIVKKGNFMHEVENLSKKFKKMGCLCEIHKKYCELPLGCTSCE